MQGAEGESLEHQDLLRFFAGCVAVAERFQTRQGTIRPALLPIQVGQQKQRAFVVVLIFQRSLQIRERFVRVSLQFGDFSTQCPSGAESRILPDGLAGELARLIDISQLKRHFPGANRQLRIVAVEPDRFEHLGQRFGFRAAMPQRFGIMMMRLWIVGTSLDRGGKFLLTIVPLPLFQQADSALRELPARRFLF